MIDISDIPALTDGSRNPRTQWLGPALALLLLAGAIVVLARELTTERLERLRASFDALPAQYIVYSVVAAILSYWTLNWCEQVGLRYLRRTLPTWQTLRVSFLSFSFGHSIGLGAVTGAAVRYRFYSPAGFSGLEVVTLAGFSSLTSGLGFSVVAALALLSMPATAAHLPHLGAVTELLGGGLIVAGIVVYLVWAGAGRKDIAFRSWRFRPPGRPIVLLQLAIGTLEIMLAAAVIWCLLPAAVAVGFVEFAGVYSIATVAGIFSHVPGGLGIFEALIVLLLPAVPRDQLLLALIGFRAIYYLAPLLVAAVLLGIYELRRARA